MNLETKLFWAQLDFLTKDRFDLLKNFFGDLERARKDFSVQSFASAGILPRYSEILLEKVRALSLEKVKKEYERSGATLFFYEDGEFPENLRNIPSPPLFLFLKGTLLEKDAFSIGVVGTRKPSQNGIRSVEHFVPDLVSAGFTILSGMATGIDAHAHASAIKAGGRTIAFWGTGIDVVYPPSHGKLAEDIIAHGAVISEFPLGSGADAFHFPRRNRLISGLSKGVLVIEGKEKSGSLITAYSALEQGKEVFSVPGSIFSAFSGGPNRLIQKGEAKLVMSASDVLEEYNITQNQHTSLAEFVFENALEKSVWSTLSDEPISFDEIVKKSGISSAEVSATLMMLVLRGGVRDLGNSHFIRLF
jgi:DNA processing protein